MVWLTRSGAAVVNLAKAAVANKVLRGTSNRWFVIDRLNEFSNFEMKTLLATRRTSKKAIHSLFRQVALIASYCSDVIADLDFLTGSFRNSRDQTKDASEDVYRLAHELRVSGLVDSCEYNSQTFSQRISSMQALD